MRMFRIDYECKRPPADESTARYLLKLKARLLTCTDWAPRQRATNEPRCGSADLTRIDLPGLLRDAARPAGFAEATELDWLESWLLARPGVLSTESRELGCRPDAPVLVVRCIRLAQDWRGRGLGLEFLRRIVSAWLPEGGSVVLAADSLDCAWNDPARPAAAERLARHYATLGFTPLREGLTGPTQIPMVWCPGPAQAAH